MNGFLNFEFRFLIKGEFIPWISVDGRGSSQIAAGGRLVVVTARSASGATSVRMGTPPGVFTRDTVTISDLAGDFCGLTRDICRDKA